MSNTARRIGLAMLGAGFAALAAFATAGPAAADNGPHQLMSGSAISSADGCAGCHRIHTAQEGGDELWAAAAADMTDFCYTCHTGDGATTNVRDGVSTQGIGDSTLATNLAMNTGARTYANKALRGGGFVASLMGADAAVQGNIYFTSRDEYGPNKYAVTTYAGPHPDSAGNWTWGNLIPVTESKTIGTTGSTHTLGTEETMWGSNTTGAGQSGVVLECTSCHNPHGNNSYRILRPVGFIETATGTTNMAYNVFNESTTVSGIESVGTDYFNTKIAETLTVASSTGFIVGQPIIVATAGVGTSATTLDSTTVQAYGTVMSKPTSTQIIVGNIGKLSSLSTSGFTGIAVPMFPTTIMEASVGTCSAGKCPVTFITAMNAGLYDGQYVTLNSSKTGTGQGTQFTVKNVKIRSVSLVTLSGMPYTGSTAPKAQKFTLDIADVGTPTNQGLEAGLYIEGIPDAVGVDSATALGSAARPGWAVGSTGTKVVGAETGRVYTTANYFIADDPYYRGSGQYHDWYNDSATTTYSSGYIVNVSQWCSTCHTRYLSDNRKINTGDSIFTYRHRSNSNSQGSPNCVQCHVAHGSSAAADGVQSSAVLRPGEDPLTSTNFEGSALLRVNNRGICLECHNPAGVA